MPRRCDVRHHRRVWFHTSSRALCALLSFPTTSHSRFALLDASSRTRTPCPRCTQHPPLPHPLPHTLHGLDPSPPTAPSTAHPLQRHTLITAPTARPPRYTTVDLHVDLLKTVLAYSRSRIAYLAPADSVFTSQSATTSRLNHSAPAAARLMAPRPP